MGGRREIFQLLASEDIQGDDVNLGVTVLAGLGGGHFDDLAGAALDDNVTVLPQSRALLRVGGGRTRVRGVEGNINLERNMLTFTLPAYYIGSSARVYFSAKYRRERGEDAGLG